MFNPRRITVLLATALGSLALTASASAAQRVATETGSGSACTAAAPCQLRIAVESASAGDEVVVNSGRYSLNAPLELPPAASGLVVRGPAGQPRPRISSNADVALEVNATQRIQDLEIEHTGTRSGLYLPGGTAERVYVHSTGDSACSPYGTGGDGGAVIRDSVCWNTRSGTGGWAVAVSAGSTAPDSIAPRLRNVTAVTNSPSEPALLASAGNNVQISIDARNVIALAPGVDVAARANGVGGSNSLVTLRTSSFAHLSVSGGSSISSPSSNGNRAAEPVFADLGAGDFHQAASSPTIDAGSLDDQVGILDLDRDARIHGAAVDIGADEIDNDAPPTNLIDGPLGVTADVTPTFTFNSTDATATFECSLDGAAFGACSGSGTHTTGDLGDGPHSFSVRAVDRAGNRDATPEVREFTVRTGPTSGTDLDPPNVTIHRGPLRRSYNRGAKFGFTSDEAGTTFECVLDSRPVRNCASPTRYRNVRSGRHVFLVFATDAAGNLDSTPAVYRWRIVR
jgi:hypothetical protein